MSVAEPIADWAAPIADWYVAGHRDLPWRRPGFTAWGILVSEFMLQQTPVARVIPRLEEWLARWPTPNDLAAVPPGEAVRAWDRLGYPRRALALHGAATAIVERHGGVVPDEVAALLELPGVGPYTARAVAAFAYGVRTPVVDTNVRRVLARAIGGRAEPGPPRVAADLAVMDALLPADPERARLVNAGTMELGQTVCTARSPRCEACPIAASCAWRAAGYPEYEGPRAPVQKRYEGSDRQVRGVILHELRASEGPVPASVIEGLWPDAAQRERALAGLLADGLAVGDETVGYGLPFPWVEEPLLNQRGWRTRLAPVPSTTLRLTAAAAGDELVTRLAALPSELGIERQFPPAALAEADRAARHPELPDRDLTEIPFATIDPAGSRDLDQAFHLERDGGGIRFFYAIADVASFVAHAGALDDEAHRRGRTIYAPDRRIPLHPTSLSEEAASLLPDRERPAFVWEFLLDAAGRVTSTSVGRARIRSRRQLDYVPVQAAIDAGNADESLRLLREVGEARLVLERERGGASLNVPETLIVHEGGRYRLERRTVLPVEKWNAQLSLLTGMAAARLMLDAGVGILRTMATADEDEFDWFRRRTHALHHPWPEGQPYGEYLDALDGSDAHQLSILHAAASLFRSAGYSPFDGHPPAETLQAAVGAPYAHVTAPLRRLVDRYGLLICEALSAGRRPDDQVLAALPELPAEMNRSSNLAGRLDHLALDAVEAAVLAPRIGESFDAVVIGMRKGVATIQVSDPAVVAHCDGHTHPGDSIRARLDTADVATGTVRFSVA